MPSLGGVTAWISVGDMRLPEYGVEIEDDLVKCYVEVPSAAALVSPWSPAASASSPKNTTPSLGTPHPQPIGPISAPLTHYTISWKIQDLTYTMAVNVCEGLLFGCRL
jgi:hypothetical protein